MWALLPLRNGIYNRGIMKSSKFIVPVINVGNLSMGGTGKSPHIEYLIRLLKDDFRLATLSRGFGRAERGFFIADDYSTAQKIGDEPLQFYKKFGEDITVAVEADRVLGAMDLFKEREVDVLLLDDAYQHRAIHPGLNILLTDYNAPFYKDVILPVGNLRESRRGKKRADIIVVTKCPELDDTEKAAVVKQIKPLKSQSVFFSRIMYGDVFDFKGNITTFDNRKIIVVTGIANATPFLQMLSKKAEIIKHFNFNDHHKFRRAELESIHNLFDKFAEEKPLILTTEKDAMRLLADEFAEIIKPYPWCYQSIEILIDRKNEFDKLITCYVKENH
ncbi:MAG: tetraacyldisaccharide 4'-kinase [Crocinitomicaceae bacterium]